MANERGNYGPSTDGHKIGTGAKIGFAVAFGLILVGLVGSVTMDLKDMKDLKNSGRANLTEADLRRARIAARAYVAKQGIR